MKVVLAYLTCAFIWGTTWYAIRACIAPGGYAAMPAAAIRFSIAAVVLLAIWALGFASPGPRNRRETLWIVAAGVLNAVTYALVYLAERDIPGALAAVIFSTLPLATAALARISGTEKFTLGAVVGSAISIIGLALIFWDRLHVSRSQATAVGFVVVAVVACSTYSVMVKRHAGGIHPIASTSVLLTSTAVVLWLPVAFEPWRAIPWPPPALPTAALLYLAIMGSVVAFASWFYLMKRVKLMTASTLVFVQPLIALVVDAFLEEAVTLSPRTHLGIGVTLAGVGVNLASQARSAARA